MSESRSVVGAWRGREHRESHAAPDALLRCLLDETRQSNRLLQSVLAQSTATLDVIVCEKVSDTPGALTSPTATATFGPQTRQVELIDGIYLYAFDSAAALNVLAVTLQLDDVVYVCNPRPTATGVPYLSQTFYGLKQPVRSDAKRIVTVVMSANITGTVTFGAMITGRAIPTTLGEVLT